MNIRSKEIINPIIGIFFFHSNRKNLAIISKITARTKTVIIVPSPIIPRYQSKINMVYLLLNSPSAKAEGFSTSARASMDY
jgi:hypothetical protein